MSRDNISGVKGNNFITSIFLIPGDIFRYSSTNPENKENIDGFPNFSFHTNLPSENRVLLESGVNPICIVKNSGIIRTPAILTGSSPHKIGSSETPWQDIYNVSKGHIKYFGDNKDASNSITKKSNKNNALVA
jgi:hypothetical protein